MNYQDYGKYVSFVFITRQGIGCGFEVSTDFMSGLYLTVSFSIILGVGFFTGFEIHRAWYNAEELDGKT